MSGLAGIIPARLAVVANGIAYYCDSDRGGGRTFSVGCVPTGSPAGMEPTHYIANFGQVTATLGDALARLVGGTMTPEWVAAQGIAHNKDPADHRDIGLVNQAEIDDLRANVKTLSGDGVTPAWRLLLDQDGLELARPADDQ